MTAGAPTRPPLIWLFVSYNVLVFLFALGVWASAGGRRAVRFTAAVLAGYGVVSTAGLLLAPMDLRGTVDSQRDARHIAVTIVISVCIVAAMVCGAFVRGRWFCVYSFATIATVVLFGALAGVLAWPMPGAPPGIGAAERVNIYATMLWCATLALALALALWRTDVWRGEPADLAPARATEAVRVGPPGS